MTLHHLPLKKILMNKIIVKRNPSMSSLSFLMMRILLLSTKFVIGTLAPQAISILDQHPPDIQYEERRGFIAAFDGNSIHTWNIDGKSESTLQEMTIAILAYKAKRLSNKQGATALAIGFQGQLKNWWDNFLSPDEREQILSYRITKTNDQGREEEEEEAASGVLIHTITLHFLGNPREEQAAAKSILINLRCPTLTDYRWYKDAFLTNVLKREDGLQQFLKERFIAGLLKLFGEHILNVLRQNFGTNDIPFSPHIWAIIWYCQNRRFKSL